MPRNKIKQDCHFTTLKRFKIIVSQILLSCTSSGVRPYIYPMMGVYKFKALANSYWGYKRMQYTKYIFYVTLSSYNKFMFFFVTMLYKYIFVNKGLLCLIEQNN
jgi:hypothetical protein